MSKAEIGTDNLELMLQTPEEVLASIDAMSPSDRAEVSPEWLTKVKASTAADPWTHGFAMVHRASGAPIGSCGYKGPPDQEGVVEIAYGVDAAHQGRGYATEAARALVAYAFGSGQVMRVRAHTKPAENASTRVLTKCGFERVGEVVDPEDGLVWRWELRLDIGTVHEAVGRTSNEKGELVD
jgi:ribosomal-protein-alanine N-acetyltransferase